MRGLKKIAILCAGLTIACSDYELNPKVEEVPVIEAPNIHVEPSSLNFGHLDAGMGESKSQVITITNAVTTDWITITWTVTTGTIPAICTF